MTRLLKPRYKVALYEVHGPYGSLAEDRSHDLHRRVVRLARDSEATVLILDLSNVDYFGATFLGMLVALAHWLRRQKKRLALCVPSPHLQNLLHVNGLDEQWVIYPSRALAMQGVAPCDREITRV